LIWLILCECPLHQGSAPHRHDQQDNGTTQVFRDFSHIVMPSFASIQLFPAPAGRLTTQAGAASFPRKLRT
jgi:hypothetical protein